MIGAAMCAVKRVRDEEPFAVVPVVVTKRSGSKWWFQRPQGVYKRGGGGVHYKLLPETFVPCAGLPTPNDEGDYSSPRGSTV